MRPGPPRRRPARPVADAPVEVLHDRAAELAKGWLLALIEQEPLAAAPSILAADLVRDGPAICAAVVSALGSDAELGRIMAGGQHEQLVSRAGELAGADTPDAVSRAVEALRAVVWSALLGALADPDGALVAELAERLAAVTEVVRGAALRRLATGSTATETVTAWPQALEREVGGSRREGRPLSLLLVELVDAERMLAAEPDGEAEPTFERFAAAVRTAVRPDDLVIVEAAARVWVIAPGVDQHGAAELAAAVASAVRVAGSWRGAPLRASIGTSVLDRDAGDAAGLIGAAEEAGFAAAAGGIEVARAGRSEDPA